MKRPSESSPEFATFDVVHTPIEDGVTLIEASAGTGKTYSLTTLAVRMLLHGEVDELREILLVTFTEKATAELKARLRLRVVETLEVLEGRREDEKLYELCAAAEIWDDDEARRRARLQLRLALSAFDEVRVQTLHGFCGQLLRESAFELGEPFSATFVEAATEVERQAVEDTWRSMVLDAPRWWAQLLPPAGTALPRLRSDFGRVRNFPDARFLPCSATLEDVRAELEVLLEEIASSLDREAMVRRVQSVKKWLKPARDEDLCARLLERLCDAEPVDAALVQQCSPAGWVQQAFARERPGLLLWFEEDPVGQKLVRWSELVDGLDDLFRVSALEAARGRYRQIKERDNLLDYDDLIARVHRTVRDPVAGPALRTRVQSKLKVALIDEFQDTDRRQWTIFSGLFSGRRLVLVGDPKQAIYGFRGADVRAYLAASAAASLRTTLDQNWRSHPDLVAAVNHLFGRFTPSFALVEIRFPLTTGARDPVGVSLVGDQRAPLLFDVLEEGFATKTAPQVQSEVLRRLQDQVRQLLAGQMRLGAVAPGEDRPLHAGDLAVLVRTGQQGREVVAALREADVPAVLAQLGDIYESLEMRELELVLRAVLRPRHRALRQRAASTLLWGATLEDVAAAGSDDEESIQRAGRWAELLSNLQEVWQREGFVPMCTLLLRERGVRPRLLALQDGERRWTNLQHSIEILDRDALDEHLDAAALVRWIARQRGERGDDERRQLRLDRDADAVQVLTVHKCKGLQFEVVLCPFLSGPVRKPQKGGLEILRSDVSGQADPQLWITPASDTEDPTGGDRARRDAVELEGLAEDLRLTYVALTRARRRCIVWTGATGKEAARCALSLLLFAKSKRADQTMADWWAEAQARAKEGWEAPRATMLRLCASSGGKWALVDLDSVQAGLRPDEPAEKTEELRAAEFPRERTLRPAKVVSFTSWTREASRLRAQDHLDPDDEPALVEAQPEVAEGIFAFARGARAGLCLHEVLERVSWQTPPGDMRRGRIRPLLERYGLAEPSVHRGVLDPVGCVDQLLDKVSRLRLPSGEGRFEEIDESRRRAEWAFDASLGRVRQVAPAALAEVFREHARGDWVEDFAARMERLPREKMHGVLTGFVDLVLRDGDRWWVLDWKSNHLGLRAADYGVAALRASMLEHHYHLQYHLYLLALHRHLRRCIPDYDCDRHLGGSIYVYLRGLDDGGTAGCYVDRPNAALIETLDRVLDGEVPS